MLRFSAWRAGHLLLGWGIYWLALLLALVGPAIPTLWRVTRPDAHGSASASIGEGAVKLVVSEGASAAWTGEIRLLTLAFLIAVPPLVLWTLWLRVHRRPLAETERAL